MKEALITVAAQPRPDVEEVIRRCQPVTTVDMNQRREERQAVREKMTRTRHLPTVTLSLVVPGAYKSHPLARSVFQEAERSLTARLLAAKMPVTERVGLSGPPGFEAVFAVEGEADTVKRLCMAVEENHPVGRLFDLDVCDSTGEHLHGERFGRAERSCLICGGAVWRCSRQRLHSAEQLSLRFACLAAEWRRRWLPEYLASLAVRAMLYEAGTTPKPGLVDHKTSGAHHDMDIFTFYGSASVLGTFFARMAAVAMDGDDGLAALMQPLQRIGLEAEQSMLAATGGVNTHKGLIYSLGLCVSAYGYLAARFHEPDPHGILELAGVLARSAVANENGPVSNGQEVAARFGLAGARGEAAAGFPSVRDTGYPCLAELTGGGVPLQRAGVMALLRLMARVDDTNIVSRSSLGRLRQLQQEIAAFVSTDPDIAAAESFAAGLDRRFQAEHISPGGSADLLALSYFLYWLCHPS